MEITLPHTDPLVSVVMPVYNAEKYLSAAISSVLTQTLTDIELIVCDDASSDDSLEIARSFSDTRITVIANDQNIGNAATRNRLISLARGKYIAILDADDLALPTRLDKQVRFLESHPDIGLCGTWGNVITPEGTNRGHLKNLTHPKDIHVNLLFSVPFIQSSVMARADIMKANPYDPDFRQSQDYELWCRLDDLTLLANIPEYLVDYRWHGTNISVTSTSPQVRLRREVNRRQIQKLGINPTEHDLDLHTAAFRSELYKKEDYKTTDLTELEQWYNTLLSANKKTKRYSPYIMQAYIWARWIVFCRLTGNMTKAFFPSFASANPLVLTRLLYYVLHFARK